VGDHKLWQGLLSAAVDTGKFLTQFLGISQGKRMTPGACLCSTVRYEVEGPFSLVMHCHCSMCRKHHGSAFGTFAIAPLMGFRWLAGEENVGRYRSSEQGERCYCKTCGSVAPSMLKALDLAVCMPGNFTADIDARPQSHFFVGSKASWYTITDELPQYEAYPPELGPMASIPRPQIEAREGATEGSCLCGKVAFEITSPPLRMYNCHCSRCRRARSAAHASNIFYKLDDFRFTRGAEHVVNYHLPGAQYFTNSFCNQCGSATARVSPERGVVVVPAGALDTDPKIQPLAHIYVGSKANWFDITDSIPQFATVQG
jgi:hypothetical protein